jgi:hypothetical protein
MHGHALTTTARIERADFVDDGLEVTRQWEFFMTLSGMLTPIGLAEVTRLGLRAGEATHSLVVGYGLPLAASDYRVIVDDRVYDVVSAANLPTHSVLALRGTSAVGVGAS